MSRTTDLCRSRSRSAAATMLSPSTSPQEVTGLFVVRMIEVFRYLCATTWNSAEVCLCRQRQVAQVRRS